MVLWKWEAGRDEKERGGHRKRTVASAPVMEWAGHKKLRELVCRGAVSIFIFVCKMRFRWQTSLGELSILTFLIDS